MYSVHQGGQCGCHIMNEFAEELAIEEGIQLFFRIAKQMARDWQDVSSSRCMKDEDGIIVTDSDDAKEV